MNETIGMIVHQSMINKLMRVKQTEILDKIDKRLDALHEARKDNIPLAAGCHTKKELEDRYSELLELRIKCADLKQLPFVEVEELNKHDIKIDQIVESLEG